MFERLKATRRLSEMEERLGAVERSFKAMQLEWQDTYDRLRTMMSRIVKRVQTGHLPIEPPPETDAAADATAGNGPAASSLSERAQKINAVILARRNRMRPPS